MDTSAMDIDPQNPAPPGLGEWQDSYVHNGRTFFVAHQETFSECDLLDSHEQDGITAVGAVSPFFSSSEPAGTTFKPLRKRKRKSSVSPRVDYLMGDAEAEHSRLFSHDDKNKNNNNSNESNNTPAATSTIAPSLDPTLAPTVASHLRPQIQINHAGNGFRFKDLDENVREIVYSLFVISEYPLFATSPRSPSTKPSRFPHPHTTELAIMRVDRQLNVEARAVFFAGNTFAFGCGAYGSPTEANLHGLELFVALVPAVDVGRIRKIDLHLYLPEGWLKIVGREGGAGRECVERGVQETLLALGRLLEGSLVGVEEVTIELVGVSWGLGATTERGAPRAVQVQRQEKLDALLALVVGMEKLSKVFLRMTGDRGTYYPLVNMLYHLPRRKFSIIEQLVRGIKAGCRPMVDSAPRATGGLGRGYIKP
ncbi:uncharacterized protein L3040_005182 [Drepanopeziza brunnea f. sp. 'multigermtubi']|uniref:uncharacterized protein n=1 Tax=Drepanopeziza brunnea f. sp. 'multigermtubi' TaxID=698441 RepID=UPI00239E0638|nr:hypothetical protein L3040_005182 [Drepanopeziza brunnea f. sp. 'multigermtubi']